MTLNPKFHWRRLLFAILAVTALSMVSELVMSGKAPTLMQFPALLIALLLYFVIYSVFLTIAYGLALAAQHLRMPSWVVLLALYISASAAYQYYALAGYAYFQQGGRDLVIGGQITSIGWRFLEQEVIVTTLLAMIATAILFVPIRKSWAPQ